MLRMLLPSPATLLRRALSFVRWSSLCLLATIERVFTHAESTKWKTAKSSSSPPHGLASVLPTSMRPMHEMVTSSSESRGNTRPSATDVPGANAVPFSTAYESR